MLAALVSCKGTVKQTVPDGDNTQLLRCLPPDESESVDTAWDIVADGTEVEGDLICPTFDDDFWHLNVVGDRQLVHINARYDGIGDIGLSLDWLGPKRVCMDAAPAACTTASDCTGQMCDTRRGGCRDSQADVCYEAGHCTGQTCTLGEADTIAGLIPESASGVNLHIVDTIVPAFIAGDYYLRIYDHNSTAAPDDERTYTLTIDQFQDPDANEPNDAPNMATAIAGGTTASCPAGYECRAGTFSYRGDVDVFELTPAFSGTAVMYLDLVYNSGTEAIPTWHVQQEGPDGLTSFLPPITGPVPGTGGFDYSLNAAYILVSNNPIRITVTNPSGAADPDAAYELRLKVFEDGDETPRDDRIGMAQDLAVNGGSATQRLVADNDVDWYHVTTGGAQNSLVDVSLVANNSPPEMAPFLLKYQVYYLTGNACSTCPVNDLALPYGLQKACLDDPDASPAIDDCADVFQRPQIFTPENWPNNWGDEYGGPTPNQLSARIPVYPSRDMYILVQHTKNTPLTGYPGYDDTATYTLALTEHNEPDPDDATNEDNHFVPEPLEGEYVDNRWEGVSYGTFHRRDRTIAGGWSQSGGATVGQNFAMLTTVALPMGQCTPLTFEIYDDTGAAASGSVTITSSIANSLWTDATCNTTALAGAVDPTATTVYFTAAAAATGTITTNMGTAIPFEVQVYDSAGAVPPALAFSGRRDGELGGRSSELTVSLPAAAPVAGVPITLQTAGNPTDIICAATGQSGDACAQPTTCTLAGDVNPCSVTVEDGETDRTFFIQPTASGAPQLVILTAAATGYIGATWVYAPRDPVVLTFSSPSAATGWITYEGDADFFTMPMPDPSLGNGTMVATLTYTGNADLRVGIVRQPSPGDWCRGSCGISITDCSSSPCTVGIQSSCYYVTSSGGNFNVWVNDEQADEYDHPTAGGGSAYVFDFEFMEGCAGFCHEYACQ